MVGSEGVKIYQFLKTKSEEEEEILGINLTEPENGGSLELGFSLGTLVQNPTSDFTCQRRREDCENGLVDSGSKNKWFSQIREKNCNSSVESENVSALQRSSEGDYDPSKNTDTGIRNVSFETGNNSSQFGLSQIIDLNVDARDDNEEEVSAASQTNSECSFRDGKFRGTSSREQNGRNVQISTNEKEGFVKKIEHPRGGLDLLLDAINLTTGGLFQDSEAKEDMSVGILHKKKRVRKNQNQAPKCKKGKPCNEENDAAEKKEMHEYICEEQGSEITVTEKGKSSEFDWYADYADTSPLVRSKRGRSQALPARFRDSVIDPWKRISRPKATSIVTAEP